MKDLGLYLFVGCLAVVGLSACGSEVANITVNTNKMANTAEKAINSAVTRSPTARWWLTPKN